MGNHVRTYDEQTVEKKKMACQIMKEMAVKGIIRRLDGCLIMQMTFHTPIPRSWSKKRSKSVLGKPNKSRPDLDNYVKMYADVMNNLIYDDDNQITHLWCEKLYSDKPRVEITITELKEGDLINEHATTVKDFITIEDLNYMVKKANKLGLKNRDLIRVFMQEDGEGKHYYFEVEGMKKVDGTFKT